MYFSEYQLFPSWLRFVRLYASKYKLFPSWLRFVRLYSSKHQLLPFLVEIARFSSVPLCHNLISHMSHHWARIYTDKRVGIYSVVTLIVPYVLCWRSTPTTGPERESTPYSGRGDPDHLFLIGSGRTRLYTNTRFFFNLLPSSLSKLIFFIILLKQ